MAGLHISLSFILHQSQPSEHTMVQSKHLPEMGKQIFLYPQS